MLSFNILVVFIAALAAVGIVCGLFIAFFVRFMEHVSAKRSVLP